MGEAKRKKASREVMVLPAVFKNRDDRDRAKALLARKVLWGLLAAAKNQAGAQCWINEGGAEAEEFLRSLDEGLWHPLLEQWWGKKEAIANRPPASERERHAQWLVCMAAEALRRVWPKLTGKETREEVAKKVTGLFERATTAKTIEHWQAYQSPLSADDEQVLAAAISRSHADEPGGRERLINYFVGLVNLTITPGTQIISE